MKKFILLLIFLLVGFVSYAQEAFIGEIRIAAFGYAPRGWAQCNGQLLQISQYQALYALIGTYYGGDGRTTFALPDLRSRIPVHAGGIPADNLPQFRHGEKGGFLTPVGVPTAVDRDVSGNGPRVLIPGGLPPTQTNYPPSLGMNYIICLEGIWPSRE